MHSRGTLDALLVSINSCAGCMHVDQAVVGVGVKEASDHHCRSDADVLPSAQQSCADGTAVNIEFKSLVHGSATGSIVFDTTASSGGDSGGPAASASSPAAATSGALKVDFPSTVWNLLVSVMPRRLLAQPLGVSVGEAVLSSPTNNTAAATGRWGCLRRHARPSHVKRGGELACTSVQLSGTPGS